MASSERFKLFWMVLARLIAWSAIGCRSNDTDPTWDPALMPSGASAGLVLA